jgi:protein-L-isoaspartate(D-aspartate) O-methyltransferase
MLADIRSEVALTRHVTGREALDSRVLSAMETVPRDAFVPSGMKHAAYANTPLPIGHGQTISQPYIVALMTDLVAPRPNHRVLEIGTGTGYQAAVLSLLCETVYSIDRVAALLTAAARRLDALGYHNVRARVGNGYLGWPEQAPFDGIVVTAAADHVPSALLEQLKPGGRMVIPVGMPHGSQDLFLFEKNLAGAIDWRAVIRVAFVPMIDRAASGDD